jgi:hypothetical protein
MITRTLYWCEKCNVAFVEPPQVRFIKPDDPRWPKRVEAWEGPFFYCFVCKEVERYQQEEVIVDRT